MPTQFSISIHVVYLSLVVPKYELRLDLGWRGKLIDDMNYFQGDAGLTGRKIIVDTYGGWGAHGGGAFSGKDYTKVDRSAAYAARWVAKSLVKAGLCRRCLVQVAYAIGLAEPLSITVFDYGTSKLTQQQLLSIVRNNFDLRPGKIVK